MIVTALACFETPAEIVRRLRDEEAVETVHVQVIRYDPRSIYFEAGDKWREIFESTREKYLAEVAAEPIANQRYRMAELQKLYTKAAKDEKQIEVAASLLEQAAKEVGGALTNERNVKLRREGEPETPEDRRRMVSDIIAEAFGKKPGEVEAPAKLQ